MAKLTFEELQQEAKKFGIELTEKDKLEYTLEDIKNKLEYIKELTEEVQKQAKEIDCEFMPKAKDLDGRIKELDKIDTIERYKGVIKTHNRKFKILIDIKPLKPDDLDNELERLKKWIDLTEIDRQESRFQEIAKELGIKVDLYKGPNFDNVKNFEEITEHLDEKMKRIKKVKEAKEEAAELGIKIKPKKCKELFESEQALKAFNGKIKAVDTENEEVKTAVQKQDTPAQTSENKIINEKRKKLQALVKGFKGLKEFISRNASSAYRKVKSKINKGGRT